MSNETSKTAGDEPTGFGQQMRDVSAGGGPGEKGAGEANALHRAAMGDPITPPEGDLLLNYMLGDGEKPGAKATEDVAAKFPGGAKWPCTIKSVSYAEWKDAQDRGTNEQTGEQNAFVTASYLVARGIVKPDLGTMFAKVKAAKGEDAPKDAAAMLRQFFGAAPGALLGLSSRIVGMSGLNMSAEMVVDVEAGKD